MLAVSQMSHSAQMVFYLVAFILFAVAAVIAWLSKLPWATCVAAGLALATIVLFWNQLALS